MNIKVAEKILGNCAIWELENMEKALSTFQHLNTPVEERQLEAVKVILKARRREMQRVRQEGNGVKKCLNM